KRAGLGEDRRAHRWLLSMRHHCRQQNHGADKKDFSTCEHIASTFLVGDQRIGTSPGRVGFGLRMREMSGSMQANRIISRRKTSLNDKIVAWRCTIPNTAA